MAISQIGGSSSSTSSSGVTAPVGFGTVAAGYSSLGSYTFTPKVGAAYSLRAAGKARLVFSDGTTQASDALTSVSAPNTQTAQVGATSGTVYLPWAAASGVPNVSVVRYIGGQYLAGDGSGNLYTSPDAITWTLRGTPWAATVADIAYNGSSLYMALGTGGQTASSPDGITWTAKTTLATTSGNAIAWGNSKFVAVTNASTSTTMIYSSTDGTTWTAGNTSLSGQVGLGLVWNGSLFAMALNGTTATTAILTSPDGTTWTAQTLPSGPSTLSSRGIYWLNGKWFFTGRGSIFTSTNGTTWTAGTYPFSANYIHGMAYGNSTYVAIDGTSGSPIVYTSTDGTTWTTRGFSNAQPIGASGYGASGLVYGTKFVTSSVYYSTNGINGGAGNFALFSDSTATVN